MTIHSDSHWMEWFRDAVSRGDVTMLTNLRDEARKQRNSYDEIIYECDRELARLSGDQPADNVVSIGSPVRARA